MLTIALRVLGGGPTVAKRRAVRGPRRPAWWPVTEALRSLAAPGHRHLYYAHGLGMRTPGLITANEAGDIPGPLPALRSAHRTEFARWGVDVDRIRSRVNS